MLSMFSSISQRPFWRVPPQVPFMRLLAQRATWLSSKVSPNAQSPQDRQRAAQLPAAWRISQLGGAYSEQQRLVHKTLGHERMPMPQEGLMMASA